ncbi:hypothetical protein AB0J27_30985 [Micromonospora chokoriensis]
MSIVRADADADTDTDADADPGPDVVIDSVSAIWRPLADRIPQYRRGGVDQSRAWSAAQPARRGSRPSRPGAAQPAWLVVAAVGVLTDQPAWWNVSWSATS